MCKSRNQEMLFPQFLAASKHDIKHFQPKQKISKLQNNAKEFQSFMNQAKNYQITNNLKSKQNIVTTMNPFITDKSLT